MCEEQEKKNPFVHTRHKCTFLSERDCESKGSNISKEFSVNKKGEERRGERAKSVKNRS